MAYIVDLCGICSVVSELVENEWCEESHVACHLLHSTKLALFFSVGELNHQTRGCTLKWRKQRERDDSFEKFIPQIQIPRGFAQKHGVFCTSKLLAIHRDFSRKFFFKASSVSQF